MSKTSQLNTLATLAQNDLIQVVDVSDTTTMTGGGGTNKKITVTTLASALVDTGSLQENIEMGTPGQYYAGDKTWKTLNKAAVGLSNVTNESKATMFTNPVFTGIATLPSATSIGDVSSTELSYLNGVTSNIQTQLDGKLSSSASSTELGYLVGVTSNIQTQLDGKQNTITGGGSTITSTNLAVSRALVSDASGKVAVSSVTSTELGRLVGVSSSIQTQLDGKANTSLVAAGSITSRSLVNRFADVRNVKDFGAIGDGTTDDTSAFQAAINSIPSIGGSIYVPAGRYKVTSTLTIANKTVSFYGDGSGQAVSATDGSFIAFHSLGTSNGFVFDNVDGAFMRDIAIVADASTRPTDGYLVVYQGTSGGFYHADWQNVLVAGGYNGMWLKNGFNFKAFNCIWKGFNGQQVVLLNGSSQEDDAQATEFTNCTIAAETSITTDLCVIDGNAASTKFTCCALLFGRHGIWQKKSYVDPEGDTPSFTYFIGGGMENLEGDCFRAESGDHIIITGAYFSADGERSRCFYTSTGFGGEITISGSYFRGAGRGGVWLEDGNTAITGSTIVNNNNPSPTEYAISNCSNNGSGVIRITTSSPHFFETNDMVEVKSVTGTVEANGIWIVTVINNLTFDLSINADSDTGDASTFVNSYITGGTVLLATASIRILPSASWVTITGNNIGGASSGLREVEYGIHNAGLNVIAYANNSQSVRKAVFQSIRNNRTSYGSKNVGLTSISGIPDPYAIDGVLSLTIQGSVSAGTYNFIGQNFVAGQKIRIVRITRNLSSSSGNIVEARIKADNEYVSGGYSQNGSTTTDDILLAPIIIDGMTTAKRITLELQTTGSPQNLVFDAQYQIIG